MNDLPEDDDDDDEDSLLDSFKQNQENEEKL